MILLCHQGRGRLLFSFQLKQEQAEGAGPDTVPPMHPPGPEAVPVPMAGSQANPMGSPNAPARAQGVGSQTDPVPFLLSFELSALRDTALSGLL